MALLQFPIQYQQPVQVRAEPIPLAADSALERLP
jgi:hypothetical protein